MHPPAGVVEKLVRKGVEPKGQVSIVFTGPFQNDEKHRVVISAMAETLSGNLQSTMREVLGGTYGVSVEPRVTNRPTGEYRITISFGCDPARAESLVKTAFRLIEEFRSSGPGEGQIADARTALRRDFETNSQRNDYLLERMLLKYEYGEDVGEVFNMRPFYDRLTAPMLRDAARAYLNPNRYVEVTLLPDAK